MFIFNYLGQLDNIIGNNEFLEVAPESKGKDEGEDFPFKSKFCNQL